MDITGGKAACECDILSHPGTYEVFVAVKNRHLPLMMASKQPSQRAAILMLMARHRVAALRLGWLKIWLWPKIWQQLPKSINRSFQNFNRSSGFFNLLFRIPEFRRMTMALRLGLG
ncbi:MAG: hypothetical protein Q8P42_03510 [Gallionella sp.]|nr:hypothetical protein [Gallionella sp.]